MKRIIYGLLIAMFLPLCANALKFGSAILVTCPLCGGQKELMSVVSGNSFGASIWSDGFENAPMMPRISPIQKCVECGDYYFFYTAHKDYSDNPEKISTETGLLSYPEAKDAFIKLLGKDLSKEDEILLRFEFLYRYNDANRNDYNPYPVEIILSDDNLKRSVNDVEIHKSNIMALIDLMEDSSLEYAFPVQSSLEKRLFLAELYREAGMFEKSLEILRDIRPDSEETFKIMETIRQKDMEKDSSVFKFDL